MDCLPSHVSSRSRSCQNRLAPMHSFRSSVLRSATTDMEEEEEEESDRPDVQAGTFSLEVVREADGHEEGIQEGGDRCRWGRANNREDTDLREEDTSVDLCTHRQATSIDP